MFKMKRDKISIIIIKLFLSIISMIISIYIFYNKNIDVYKSLFLLPLTFSICIFIFDNIIKYSRKNIGLFIYLIIMVIRFVLLPFVMILSNKTPISTGVFITEGSFNTAIYILMYELISVNFVIHFLSKFIYNLKYNNEVKNISNKFILKITLVCGGGIILIFPSILQRYNFIFSNEVSKLKTNFPLDGLLMIILDCCLIIVPMLLINNVYIKYKNNLNKKRYVTYALLIVIPFISIFKNTSRWSLIIPAIFWTITLMKLFKEYKKRIIMILLVIISVGVLNITIYKRFSVNNKVATENADITFMAEELNLYFSGPIPLARAIDMKHSSTSNISKKTFFNDLFANLAIASNYIDRNDTLEVKYNYYIYGVSGWIDQIIPLVGQSFVYFGFIGSNILSVISVILLMLFDNKAKCEKRLEFSYIWYFSTMWLSLSMMLNGFVTFTNIINTMIPMYILLCINKKIELVKHNKCREVI